jgi:gamma-glutamylcyclotransferase (GGCT)/AIG2-like uncharacterized protein YtfP
MSFAHTTLEHLGGNKFRIMTGAKNFVGDDKMLQFDLPWNLVKGRGKRMVITIQNDLYVLELYRIHKMEAKVIDKIEAVDVENLRRTFTMMTGLDTSLGR